MGALAMEVAKVLPEKTIHAMTGYVLITEYLAFLHVKFSGLLLGFEFYFLLNHVKTSANNETEQTKVVIVMLVMFWL